MAMSEGTIAKWFVAEGDAVVEGQELVEVEAAKVTNTVTAPAAGVIGPLLVPEDETVEVNTVLVEILAEAEASGAAAGEDALEAAVETAGTDVPLAVGEVAEVRPTEVAPDGGVDVSGADVADADAVGADAEAGGVAAVRRDAAAAREASGRVTGVVPLARKLAKEKGVDLHGVTGTGTGGRIVVADVEAAIASASAPKPPKPMAAGAGAGTGAVASEAKPAVDHETRTATGTKPSTMRRVIAERMTESLRSTAQLTLTSTADVTDFAQLRETIGGGAPKPGYVDAVIRACALALREHPVVRTQLVDDQLVEADAVNVGMAVALDDGLVVPVIRDADQLGLAEIGARVRELAGAARSGELSPDDYAGGTFTVTSLGGQGIDAFTPILNPPQAAILGVGRSREVPVRFGSGFAWRQEMTLSLTIDHRVIDGYPGALFLQDVVRRLERPRDLL